MRLAVLDRLALGRVERFPIGAAPSLIRIAFREGAAAVRFDGMDLAPRRPAILQRQLLRAGRGRLVAAGRIAACHLIIGNGAVFGMGRRRVHQQQDRGCYSAGNQQGATHRTILSIRSEGGASTLSGIFGQALNASRYSAGASALPKCG